MKTTVRVLSMMLALGAGLAFAQASSSPTMDEMKSMMMKERSEMMNQAKAIDSHLATAQKAASAMEGANAKALDAQLVSLQAEVRSLRGQLEKAPKYLDQTNKNRP